MVRQRAHRNESLGGLRGQYKTKTACTHAIDQFFSDRKLELYQQSLTARSIFEHALICSPSQFARLHGSSNGSASRKIIFFVRVTAYERHFRGRAQAHSAIFSFGTRLCSSSERACWVGDVRSVFVFCVCFPMFVYLLKIVPYCTYPSRVESIQQAP